MHDLIATIPTVPMKALTIALKAAPTVLSTGAPYPTMPAATEEVLMSFHFLAQPQRTCLTGRPTSVHPKQNSPGWIPVEIHLKK